MSRNEVGAALQNSLARVYMYIGASFAMSSMISYVISYLGGLQYFTARAWLFIAVILFSLIIVSYTLWRKHKMSIIVANILLFLLSMIRGFVLVLVLQIFDEPETSRAFMIVAADFFILGFFYYKTKISVSPLIGCLILILLGGLLIVVANSIAPSSYTALIIVSFMVIIVSGFVSYFTPNVKRVIASKASNIEDMKKRAIIGAIELYVGILSFVLDLFKRKMNNNYSEK